MSPGSDLGRVINLVVVSNTGEYLKLGGWMGSLGTRFRGKREEIQRHNLFWDLYVKIPVAS
jgi:hypothetical protein